MAGQPTYPGVYVRELPSGARTLAGVSTSITAFAGYTPRGPLNTPVQILNFGDYQRVFGGLDPLSELSYAIYQYFLNGGGVAWVSRVVPTTPAPATLGASGPNGPFAPTQASVGIASGATGPAVLTVSAADPGAWGNRVQVSIDADTLDPATTFNFTATEYAVKSGVYEALGTISLPGVTLDATQPNFIGGMLARKPNPLVAIKVAPGAATPPLSTGITAPIPADPTKLSGATFSLTLSNPTRTLGPSAPLSTITTAGDIAPALQAALQDLLGGMAVQVSLMGNGTSQPSLRILFPDPSLAGTVPAFSGPLIGKLTLTANVQAYQLGVAAGAGVAAVKGSDPTRLKAASGGGAASLVPVTPGQIVVDRVSLVGSLAARTGLYAFEGVDLFNILSVPDIRTFAFLVPANQISYSNVASAAAAYCETRRAFAVLDLPADIDSMDAARMFAAKVPAFASPNAAVYFPDLVIADPADASALRGVGASGTLAGLYARTDAARGVWKAPAGSEARLKNLVRLAYALTDDETGVLNPLGVNTLRTQSVYGIVSWGARTLMGADQLMSEWKYIPVRRLALFLEESLKRGLFWTVFEPNDEILWAQIRLEVGSFLQNLFVKGAFAGQTPSEAFYVACDRSTTSAEDLAQGVVNVQIGFAPLRPAEFVFLNVRQFAGQAGG